MKKICQNEKIIFAGELKGQSLITELKKIDVGLALYNLNRVNKGTTSNKLWQYLAMGKPVVVSNLPNLRDNFFPAKSVYILSHENELISTIIHAANEDSEDHYKMRMNFAEQNSWDSRIVNFLEIYNHYFPKVENGQNDHLPDDLNVKIIFLLTGFPYLPLLLRLPLSLPLPLLLP